MKPTDSGWETEAVRTILANAVWSLEEICEEIYPN